MSTRVTVRYDPEADRLTGEIAHRDPDAERDLRTASWSEELDFHVGAGRVLGFEIRDFHYFTEFLPFYRLFGPDFVRWLSGLQDRVTGQSVADTGDYDVPDEGRTKRDQEFERRLARA